MIPRKNAPYNRTDIGVDKSQMEIQKLLLEYGAEGIQWIIVRDGLPKLAFVIEANINGTRRKLGVQIDPPIIGPKKSSQGINYKQSMRLLYWYVKSKLEAVAYGIKTFEQEFLDDLIYTLPDGRNVKVSDIILKQVADGKDINLKMIGDGK